MRRKPKARRRCAHQWITVVSYGALGHAARCKRCGRRATFMRED